MNTNEFNPAAISELIQKLRIIGTDSQHIEVKSNIGKSVRPTLSAFSNAEGGLLIVGLSEPDGFTPVENFNAAAAQDQLMSYCGELTPVVHPHIEIMPFEGSLLLVAKIEELFADQKPCYITAQGRYGGSYRRTGEGDKKLIDYEVDRLIEEKTQPRWDDSIITEASLADLDPATLANFLESEKTKRPRTFAHGEESAMQRLRVLREGHPTLASLLVLGEYPQEFFPRLTVTFALFPGTSKGDITTGIRLLDSVTLNGPIPELVEESVALVAKNMRTGAMVGDVYRKELPDYPLIAVREAVVNALMHRDYSPASRGTQVQINMFVDRLEITSPGGLYGGVKKSSLGEAGVSSTRNQRLSLFLENVSYPGGGAVAENRGTGFAVMQHALAKALMPPVEVINNLTEFTVVFRRRKVAPQEQYQTVNDKVRHIFLEINGTSSYSITELIEATSASRTAIQRAVNKLIDDGIVEPTEPPRSPKQRYRRTR